MGQPAGTNGYKGVCVRLARLSNAAAVGTPVLLVLGAMAATAATPTTAQAQAQALVQAQASHPAASGQAVLSPTRSRALSSDVTDKVIVVFRNQVAGLPDTPAHAAARSVAVANLQRGVLSELAAAHARDVTSISLVNAVAATVSPGAATLLAANPAVAEVIPDAVIRQAGSPTVKFARAARFKPLSGACAPKGKVQLDPEAIETIHAAGTTPSAQGLGYTGTGVKVAYIADGINVNDPDFIRANGKHVFVDYKDFSGTGTGGTSTGAEAFLDSSSIAAQGREVYNVDSYGTGLTVACDIRILGAAPGVSMVGLNVFSPSGDAYTSSIVEAVNYAVTKDHVNVINESLGSNYFPDVTSLDLFAQADQAAVRAGVTVTASSGDSGMTNTIASPASDPGVISVGASTTYRGYAQTGAAGITAPGVKGWLNDNISAISSAGFEETGATVDVVAPGDQNWALCSPDPVLYSDCVNAAGNPTSFQLTGGTSEAAPLIAGVAALVIQAYREAHGGATPTPAVVKRIMASTAENINAPADQQGAGLVDAYQAVLAARSYHVAKRSGQAILASATQLNAVAQPGTSEHFNETLTNDGAKAVTVGLTSRALSPYTTVAARSLTLTQAGDYETTVTFTVPKGQARLSASVTAVTPADTALAPQYAGLLNISLISPSGKFAAYNLPQGVGDYGNAQVADPQPGTWTALISTIGGGTGAPAPAKFAAGTATWQAFGSLSARSLTLAPGASGAVTLAVATPAQAGDESGSILLRSSAASPAFAVVTSIPVTLRSLIPAPDPTSTVTGTLTGGNGRSPLTGQTAYYQARIPAGMQALNVSATIGDDSDTLFAELVDPSGDVVSGAANALAETTLSGTLGSDPEPAAQLHAMNPAAGLWTVIVNFYNTVSGTAITEPFTITLNSTPVAAAAGLPNSAATTLAAGQPVTAMVTVTNNTTTPEAYFTDARLNRQATISLATTTPRLTLPNNMGVEPEFLVPSHTTALHAAVSSPDPVYFDFSWTFGDPDIGSTTGKTATGTYSAAEVPDGYWGVTPSLQGPFVAEPENVVGAASMTATTAAFDPAVTAGTGDLWLGSTNAAATFAPYVAQPGQSVIIPVTITPEGKAGTVVSGTIYVADSSLFSYAPLGGSGGVPLGSDVAAFPYSYTIGGQPGPARPSG
jgi:Subtilase family